MVFRGSLMVVHGFWLILVFHNSCMVFHIFWLVFNFHGFSVGLGEIGPEAKISKLRLAHLDLNGNLHPKLICTPSAFQMRFSFLHLLQVKNAQNRPKINQN